MILWNLIHGCHRKSEGCRHCYVFTRDEENGIQEDGILYVAIETRPQGTMEDSVRIHGNDLLLIRFLYRGDGRMAQRGLADDAYER